MWYILSVLAELDEFGFGNGPIVKWYYAAFALPRRESDSPWVHIRRIRRENCLFCLENARYFRSSKFLAVKHHTGGELEPLKLCLHTQNGFFPHLTWSQ